MKIKLCLTGFLLLGLCAGVQLRAQQSDANSVESIKAKAEKGDALAQFDLGCYYHDGQSVLQDYAEAMKWYRKAAEQGNAQAQFNLGNGYYKGEGVTQDYSEAVKWYRKAADQGEVRAQINLALCYSNGKGVTQDYPESVKWDRKAAEQGDLDAQNSLGDSYFNGRGVPQNYAEAIKWFRKSADQGNAQAQYNIGQSYCSGQGVTQDYVKAVEWYRKAAEQGHVFAQYNLGHCYSNGEGVEKDYAESAKWYRKAALQGADNAQYNLGTLYITGNGVEKDYMEAEKWFRKSAEQNNAGAQHNLGVCYENGAGVEKNVVEAVKWYRKAAEQGYALGQYQLGRSYYFGDGVLLDYAEAVKWNALAAAQGNEDAVNTWSYVLKEKVPADQIAEGQRRAAAFVPHKEIAGQQSSNSNISNSPANPTFTGTGFFITDDGYLISNYHVVKGAAKVRLLTGAGLIDAAVVKVDAANDLALLKAVGRFAPLPIAASRTVKLGGTVATVGFPDIGLQGFAPKLAKGEIASLAGAADDPRYFQISLPVQPGNSGGALVDARGNVVGIVAAKLNARAALEATGSLPENVNYAVKSSLLLSFLESVPDVDAKLKEPKSLQTATPPFEDVVKSAQEAAVLVLVY